MDLLFIIATFFILGLLSFSSAATAASSSKKAVATTSALHFYMHDILGTSNDSAVVVTNSTGKTAFGRVVIINDKLTEGPSFDSEQVGRGQGMYLYDSQSEYSVLVSFTAVFDNGTISMHGQDPTTHKTREVSVIGGTGAFRFTTGYAVITTNFFKGLYYILEVTVFLRQQ